MSDTHEVWKAIAESKGLYSVSDKGRVRNNETGCILKPVDFSRGYLKVSIKNGDRVEVNRMVHRLVAMAFIPNPENKPEVNHKNGIHGDNCLENLEWATGEENRSHAYETGLARHKDDRYSGYLYGIWKNRKCKNRIRKWDAEWNKDFLVFWRWCLDNGYSEGKHICLKDCNKGYYPDNCYISNNKVNKKRRDLYEKYICFGEEMTIPELSAKYNIQNETLKYRLKKGMSAEEAVTTPLMAKGRPRKEVI